MNKLTLHGFLDYVDRSGLSVGELIYDTTKTASINDGRLFAILVKLAYDPRVLAHSLKKLKSSAQAFAQKGGKALMKQKSKAEKAQMLRRRLGSQSTALSERLKQVSK